jgi:hypothetical protein
MSPIGVVYGNAEVRGRLRVWKKQLAQQYGQFDVGYESLRDGKLKSIPRISSDARAADASERSPRSAVPSVRGQHSRQPI